MRIITDSAADFTPDELERYRIRCVPMQVMFGSESFSASSLSGEAFWQRLLSGEIAKTSQPSPDAFLSEFEAALEDGEDVLCIVISSALSGTMQSALIDAVASQIEKFKLDPRFPIIPLYTHNRDNCDALIRKLSAAGHAVEERMLTALGPTLAAHIGPGAYGAAFVAEA